MAIAPRKRRHDLPPLELECLQALWALGQATVHDIHARILTDRNLAYTTVMTVMDRLARKGMVEREKDGRAHRYRPRLTEQQARYNAVENLVTNFFQGSREQLASHLRGASQGRAANTPAPDTANSAPVNPDKGGGSASEEIEPSLL